MIPVTIIKAIYIRKGPGVSFDYLGVMPPGGKQVNMDGTVTGESHKGINTWYYLVNTNGVKQYYWGGGVSVITVPTEPAPGAEMPAMPPPVTALPPVVVPQWMNDLQLPEIWKKATGAGVGIAIVDTGIAPGIDDLPYNTNTFFTYAPGVSLTDKSGHGTNCAGLAGARNSTGKYIGVAPDCNLFVCKISENIFFDTPADTIRYADAINWCAAQKDIHVISISWGNAITDATILSAIQTAVTNAVKNNKIVICAMGEAYNFGEATQFFPACSNGSFGIGAIPVTDTLYPFVNSHLLAATTGFGMQSYYKDGSVVQMDGTSQANAAAAGIIALMIQKAGIGNYTNASIKQSLQTIIKPASFTADGTTLPIPVIDGNLLLQHFIPAT